MKKPKPTKSKAKTKTRSEPKFKSSNKTKKSVSTKIMLVYGYGGDARPRAAAFTEPDFQLARKAADLLGLKVFVAAADKMKSELKGIKSGNVYASGDGFAPKIPQRQFVDLLLRLDLTPPVPPAPMPTLPVPTSWATIDVGHLLLAPHDDPALGYWECVVEALDGDTISLQARDFPEVAPIKRNRFAVALLYSTDYVPPENIAAAAPGLPADWKGLKGGHLVLANLGPREGWYPAIATERDGQKVTLHWQDEPKPTFILPLIELALLYPKAP